MGGLSTIYILIYVQGSIQDCNDWIELRNASWSYDSAAILKEVREHDRL